MAEPRVPTPPGRRGRIGVVPALAVAVAAAATVAFLVRLPAAVRDFDRRATSNDRATSIGRTIAAADGIAVSNDFLVHALSLLPPKASYVLALPQSQQVADTYHISPTTMNALPRYTVYLLLPRREVSPRRARYLLCYACNTDPYASRLHRLWTDPKGFVIGRLDP